MIIGVYLVVGVVFTAFRIFAAWAAIGKGPNMTKKGFIRYLLMEVFLGTLIWPIIAVLWAWKIYECYHGHADEVVREAEDARTTFYEDES